MCASYFGEAYPDKLARMKLQMIMSDVAGPQGGYLARISTIDFDLGLGRERNDRRWAVLAPL